jgi:DNA-binding YbaB/EbfC family protein
MFDAFKNLGNFGDLLTNMRQMQEKMKQLQAELAKKTVTAEAGAGMVQATVNGRLELTALKIDKSKLDVNDTELLEDVIVAAVAAAQSRAAEMLRQEMQKQAQEMGIPPNLLGGM